MDDAGMPTEATERPEHEIIDDLARGARPAELTEGQRLKLLREWESADRTIAQAKKMLVDAVVYRDKCAATIVEKLGASDIRYKDTLYRVRVKKGVVVLEPQKKRAK